MKYEGSASLQKVNINNQLTGFLITWVWSFFQLAYTIYQSFSLVYIPQSLPLVSGQRSVRQPRHLRTHKLLEDPKTWRISWPHWKSDHDNIIAVREKFKGVLYDILCERVRKGCGRGVVGVWGRWRGGGGVTWKASSRAGAMIRPIGPSPSWSGGCTSMCRNMGRRKARVLPEPVLATAIRSRPHMIAGMAGSYM